MYVIKDLCDIGEYLDYSNCKCRKKLFEKLIEECTENIDELEIASKNKHKNECSSCTLYIVLFSIFFTFSIEVTIYFAYFYWYLKNDARVMLDTCTETTFY